MNTAHKIFFAIPFDSATRRLYDRVCSTIRTRYPHVTTVIGSDEVGPSPEYSTIASFKAQNRELTKQFAAQIREADIVIADLTHNNPNVHVELGMALMQNKNILRVTGRSFSELGFDIRNLQVLTYSDEETLTKAILNYCDIFFRIKQLPISREWGPLYFHEPSPIRLRASKRGADIKPFSGPNFVMRDGAIRVSFELLSCDTQDDWFGIYFRVGVGSHPYLGSHLLFVRQNGKIEIAVYPGPNILRVRDTKRSITGRQELIVEFENNHFHAQLGEADLQTEDLSLQTVGSMALGAWNADVDIDTAEVICRDTIAWD
jgi:hypothetical protein